MAFELSETSMKVFRKDELVAKGEMNNAGIGDDMFLFEGLTGDCLRDLNADAENVTASLPAEYWEARFPNGKPEAVNLTIADLNHSANSQPTFKVIRLNPDSENFAFELSTAVRQAIRQALAVIWRNRSESNPGSWIATLQLEREEKYRKARRKADGKAPSYKQGS